MKLTRIILLGLAFVVPSVATMAKAEDKAAVPAAAEGTPAPEGEKKAKKSKKAKKDEKKEGEAAAAPAPAAPAAEPAKK